MTKIVILKPQALANAVHAYALHVDDLDSLSDAVAMMVHRHISFDVLPGKIEIICFKQHRIRCDLHKM